MTTDQPNRVKIAVTPGVFPTLLTLADMGDRDALTWLVELLPARCHTVCDYCNGAVHVHEKVYVDRTRFHPSHPQCWMDALPTRNVRVVSVSYSPLH